MLSRDAPLRCFMQQARSASGLQRELAQFRQEPRQLQPGVDAIADADMAEANFLRQQTVALR